MNPAARAALAELLGDRVAFGVAMARHTSLRVGGEADAVASPDSAEEVVRCLALCREHDLALTAVGGGFNVLVRDGGLRGLVLRTAKLRGIAAEDADLRAEAGVSHSQVARRCGEAGLRGLEFAAGIPGSVGGWVAMNAGVPAREMRDALRSVVVASADGLETRAADAMGFRYRGADGLAAGEVVIGAHFALAPGDPAQVREEIEKHLAHRRSTQPVDQPSCGSVFKNPPGAHAGALIEAAGLKGLREGGAQISSLHANFIVTTRAARAGDVLALIEAAQQAVLAHAGVLLEPEVRILGEPA